MKFLIAFSTLCFGAALVSALVPVQPSVPVDPAYTYDEWQALFESQRPRPERCEGCQPGSEPQPDIAGRVAAAPRRHGGGSRIIGGEVAARGQFPWQVQVRMDNSFFCGGSIIGEQWIMSAGHCGKGFSTFVIVMGSQSSNTSGNDPNRVTVTTRDVIVHEQYNAVTISNDISVIKLNEGIKAWNDYIRPVRLPAKDSPSFAGEPAVLSGWGRYGNSTVSSSISPDLRFVNLAVIDNEECAKAFGWAIRATNICTSGKDIKGACNGDSGGALIVRNGKKSNGTSVQVGIVSFGTSLGCNKGYPSAYTRVSSFLKWISSNTNIAT